MKEDKKEDDDKEVNTEVTEIEQPEKKARLDETEDGEPVVEQNGIAEPQSEPMDDDVQEIKSDVPCIEIPDDELKAINSEDSVVADTVVADPVVKINEVVAEPESEPVKETPAPAVKTTPPRGGRGGRGRGVARRGRSSR